MCALFSGEGSIFTRIVEEFTKYSLYTMNVIFSQRSTYDINSEVNAKDRYLFEIGLNTNQ